MTITESGTNELTISGNIKTIDDSITIKDAVKRLQASGGDSILLRIPDSFSMPSAVIGFLMKLVNHDKVKLSIKVGDPRLGELLDELQLTAAFRVTCTTA